MHQLYTYLICTSTRAKSLVPLAPKSLLLLYFPKDSRVYFARDFIFSTVPTKYFAHIPAIFI